MVFSNDDDDSDDEDTMSVESLTVDSDTPLDLSMKTGKIWNTKPNNKGPSKRKGNPKIE